MNTHDRSRHPMTPTFKNIEPKKLVGRRLRMSLADNKTAELWRSFMPFRKDIRNRAGEALFSMQVYDSSYSFSNVDAQALFDKWAAVEVTGSDTPPEGMETFELPAGLYAVFIHKGPASEGEKSFRYIFGEWLPASAYEPDHRPHFELLGHKYRNNDPDSEEEIWIPVKPKA